LRYTPEGLERVLLDQNNQPVDTSTSEFWTVAAERFRIETPQGEELSVTEHYARGGVQTLIANDSFCMIWERAPGEAEPTIQNAPATSGQAVVVSPANDEGGGEGNEMCGGCVVVWGRTADFDFMDCSIIADTWCQYCQTIPCPPPGGGGGGGNDDDSTACFPGSDSWPECVDDLLELLEGYFKEIEEWAGGSGNGGV
jgi:hypothetical protein